MSASPAALFAPSAIAERARVAGVALTSKAAEALAVHARAVLAANERLHLTAITQPEAFFERHLGEAFEGAALLPEDVSGVLLDLGSGNGYPGIPLALARPGLVPVLAEASSKKAAFLRGALTAAGLEHGSVLEIRVARTADLTELPPVAVLATRAMGGWERIVPKLITRLAPNGLVLVWAGSDATTVMKREAWKRLHMDGSRELPGRDRSSVYRLSIL
jgi:16S rRNA (guanine527-N7)-methyltransferase